MNPDDLTVERNFPSGSLTVFATVPDRFYGGEYLAHRIYYGYTEQEAREMFAEEFGPKVTP